MNNTEFCSLSFIAKLQAEIYVRFTCIEGNNISVKIKYLCPIS